MNFFKIIILFLFATFSSVAVADNHDSSQTSTDQENVSSSELLEDEEVPLNDPFAGNEGQNRNSNIPEDIRIGAILRKDDIIIRTSKFIFEKKDVVVFLAKRDQLPLVERLFQISSI